MSKSDRRAARASVALAEYESHAYEKELAVADPPQFEESVRDLLADLMHFCDKFDIHFMEEFRIARNNYFAEIEEDI